MSAQLKTSEEKHKNYNMNTFHLVILTPYGRYLDSQVTFLEVRNDKYSMGITAGHAPLVSTVSISKMKIRFPVGEYQYATGGGIINVEKEKVTLILDSIERSDEIDFDRANESMKRAKDRLEQRDEEIDIVRAKSSLMRALNRLDFKQNN